MQHSSTRPQRRGKKPYHTSNRSPKRGGNKSRKQYINPERFINRAVVTPNQEAPEQPTHLFTDFGLDGMLEANLAAAGFTTPSAIQDKTIPLALEAHDVIGLANTGTGKTAAFLLPILHKLRHDPVQQSVLILAPTRELAQQIDAEFARFARGMRLYSAVCVGGVNINPQIRQLRRRPHVIIGTPGRLKDLLQRGDLQLEHINTLVLDEADRMLDMGFINDIRTILTTVPRQRQTLCFSATMSDAIKSIVHDFMHKPELVSVKVTETSDHIYQDIVRYDGKDHKHDLLVSMLSEEQFEKVIIFGETKYGVQRLSDKLSKHGITSAAIHGNKSQGQRMRALQSFKSNQARVLVATDVAARGLDIPNVSHVINFDTPTTYDDYVHRIGRTGRGGKTGHAYTFVEKNSR